MKQTAVEIFVSDPANRRQFLQEKSILDTTEAIYEAMEQAGIDEQELARRVGKSVRWINGTFNGKDRTIRELADIMAVLGCQFEISFKPFSLRG